MWKRSWHQRKKPSLKWNLLTFRRNTTGLFWRRTSHFYPKEQGRPMSLTWSIPWWSSGSAAIIHILSKVAKKDCKQILLSLNKYSWIKNNNNSSSNLLQLLWLLQGKAVMLQLSALVLWGGMSVSESECRMPSYRSRTCVESNVNWNSSSGWILLPGKDNKVCFWPSGFSFFFFFPWSLSSPGLQLVSQLSCCSNIIF